MVVSLNKKWINSEDIVSKICKGRQIIGCLNALWCDKNISLETKKRLRKAMVESMKYGSLRERNKGNLGSRNVTWSARVSRLQKSQTPLFGAKCKQNNQF